MDIIMHSLKVEGGRWKIEGAESVRPAGNVAYGTSTGWVCGIIPYFLIVFIFSIIPLSAQNMILDKASLVSTGDGILFAQADVIKDSDVKTTPLLENYFESRKRTLFVKTELIRYLNDLGQTEFHLIYKIPNNEMQFLRQDQGYVATLDIKFDIYLDDTLVSPNSFEYLAGAQSITIAQSENHYVLDKIEFTLAREGFSAVLEIHDKNATNTFTQRYDLPLLNPETVISEIEISHGVSTDLNPALDKFQRGRYQFYVDPIPVIDGGEKDFIIFYQVSNIAEGADSQYKFFEYIKIKGDDVVYENEYNQVVEFLPYPVIKRIPIGDWKPGLYTLEITITDPKLNKTYTAERTFSVARKYVIYTQRVFPDDTDEFDLISYFLDNRQKRLFRGLNEQGQKNYIERFWVANDPNPANDENAFLQSIRLRVNEANWRFSSHRAGWRSDMGRIYIKYGNPDTINRRETPSDARYSRKPYHVWRYSGSDRTYVFLDFQGNGNFRLVYTKNDETELPDPGWQGYFGTNFRESEFDN